MHFSSAHPNSTSPNPIASTNNNSTTTNGVLIASQNTQKMSYFISNTNNVAQSTMLSSSANILSSASNPTISNSVNINGTNNGLSMQSGVTTQARISIPPSRPLTNTTTDSSTLGRPTIINSHTAPSQETLNKVLAFLQQYNFKESEESLKKEYQLALNKNLPTPATVSLSETYITALDGYIAYVQDQPDSSRHEFAQLIYPLFVHMYLDLIDKDHLESAQNFFDQYVTNPKLQKLAFASHDDDLPRIKSLLTKEQIAQSEYVKSFRQNGRYWIKLCNASLELLDQFLIKQQKYPVLTKIVQTYFQLEINEGSARNAETQQLLSGGRLGEIKSEDNSSRMYYGLLRDHDLTRILQHKSLLGSSSGVDNDDGTVDDQPVTSKARKRVKRDIFNPRQSKTSLKVDPNAPPLTRIPIPELREHERMELINTFSGKILNIYIDFFFSIKNSQTSHLQRIIQEC